MFAPRKKNGGPVCEVNDVMWSQNEAAHKFTVPGTYKYVPGTILLLPVTVATWYSYQVLASTYVDDLIILVHSKFRLQNEELSVVFYTIALVVAFVILSPQQKKPHIFNFCNASEGKISFSIQLPRYFFTVSKIRRIILACFAKSYVLLQNGGNPDISYFTLRYCFVRVRERG